MPNIFTSLGRWTCVKPLIVLPSEREDQVYEKNWYLNLRRVHFRRIFYLEIISGGGLWMKAIGLTIYNDTWSCTKSKLRSDSFLCEGRCRMHHWPRLSKSRTITQSSSASLIQINSAPCCPLYWLRISYVFQVISCLPQRRQLKWGHSTSRVNDHIYSLCI